MGHCERPYLERWPVTAETGSRFVTFRRGSFIFRMWLLLWLLWLGLSPFRAPTSCAAPTLQTLQTLQPVGRIRPEI